MPLLIGLGLGALAGWLAYRLGALSATGAAAAALMGGLILGLGGWPWAILLLAFFCSSSALSRIFTRRKSTVNQDFSKGSRRDWAQVLANGGLGAGLALANLAWPGELWPWVAFTGAMAAVNADTWATEIGVLSRAAPRLVTTFQPAERGASGAVSLPGSAAALAGAALIGLLAAWLGPGGIGLAASAALGGLAGSFADSYLGATVQAMYYCPACEKLTEKHPIHACGAQTGLARGLAWFNNDLVNLICSCVGAGVTAVLYFGLLS